MLAEFALVLAALAACGCERPARSSAPRLVVVYATCSLNKQFLAPYDATVGYTPNLEAFAADSLVFTRHQTESGQSGVAFAALFSGSQAYHHGIYSHPARLAPEVELITERYAAAGWDVHSWLGHAMASARLGYAQGVASENAHGGILQANSPALIAILSRLSSDPSYRALLITSFTVTHGPYQTNFLPAFCQQYPEECRAYDDEERFHRLVALYTDNHLHLSFDFTRTVEQLGLEREDVAELREVVSTLYKSNVFQLDRMFGALLQQIENWRLSEESLVAFTADHGEVLSPRNGGFRWTHGFQLAPEVLSVPFVLRGPAAGVRPGRYAHVTRAMDVFPTLAGLSGVEAPECEACGRDLSATLRGGEVPKTVIAFSHTALLAPQLWQRYRRFPRLAARFPRGEPEMMWVAARDGDDFFKRRRTPEGRWETVLFDLASDPRATTDRFDPRDERHMAMESRLAGYKARLIERYDEQRGAVAAEEQEERLRSLGYIE